LLAETERVLLVQALKETEGNVPMAAQLLHISESWLYNRIKRYELK
jgi:DNA-binding NtrC family response regulator